MHILVIVKRIDTSNKSEAEKVLDLTDITAINQAVFLRDTNINFNKVSVLCIAPLEASQVLRECFALGADAGYLLSDPLFERIDIEDAVMILYSAINKIGNVDLVLMCSPANDNITVEIGEAISERLKFSHAGKVVKFDYQSGKLNVRNLSHNKGTTEKAIDTPALINMACDSTDKFQNARRIMKVFKKEIKVWDAADLNLDQRRMTQAKRKVSAD